jgi:hypothetical protein
MVSEMFGSEEIVFDELWVLPIRFIIDIVNASLNAA